MSQADEAAVLDFAQKLPVHDLLFLPRNISEPKVLSAWVKEIERGAITSIFGGSRRARVVGCGTLVRDPWSWSPHVGEIRNVVSSDVRGQGVGAGAVARDICPRFGRRAGKARCADDGLINPAPSPSSRAWVSRLRALLRDHVKDKAGKTHDIVVLGHMWRRSEPSWKLMGFQEPCSIDAAESLSDGQIAY